MAASVYLPVLATWVYAFCFARSARIKHNANFNTSAKAVKFQCPPECQECCTYGFTFGSRASKEFKCVLWKSFGEAVAPVGRKCGAIKRRDKKGLENQAKVSCKYHEGEYKSRKDSTSELSAKCSTTSRCCCDRDGVSMCMGNRFHEDRLKRLYEPAGKGAPYEELFPFTNGKPPKLNSWGTCPAGFSDWSDGVDRPCECASACGDKSKQSWPPEPRAKNDAHIWRQMVGLAAAVYVGEPVVSGWTLEKLWDVEENSSATDNVAVYRRQVGEQNQCTLAFAGTDDLDNIVSDVFGWMKYAKKWCGFEGVHGSFQNYMRSFMNGRRYQEFDTYLSTKCDRVNVVGHSLGGALAELMAACANRPDSEANISKKVNQIHFKADAVYTFGACAVSTELIIDRSQEDPESGHCFEGARFFLEQVKTGNRVFKHSVDPIANIGSWRIPSALVHPKLDVVHIIDTVGKNSSESKVTYDLSPHCDSKFADDANRIKPKSWKQLQAPWGKNAFKHNYLLHNTKEYFSRLMRIPELD